MAHATTIEIPKKTFEDLIEAARRVAAAHDLLEDFLLISDHRFMKKMNRLRKEHVRRRVGNWHDLKIKHGV